MSSTYATAEEALAQGEAFVYRGEGESALRLHVFGHREALARGGKQPAIFLIHGGGWRGGRPAMLAPQCVHFASRGLVAISIQYRLLGQPGVEGPQTCLADAKAAWHWVIANAEMLGIDPARIAAGGGSAGGHLASALVSVPGHEHADDPGRGQAIRPAALVLYNPVYDLVDGWSGGAKVAEQAGLDLTAFSPAHQVRPGFPPTLVLSGELDELAPPALHHAFVQRMKAAANQAEFIEYQGAGHGFFNFKPEAVNPWFTQTLQAADRFLAERGLQP